MRGVRTMAACLKAAERDALARVLPFPQPAAPEPAPALAPAYGSAHRLKPVFTEGRANACPCCNASAWRVGRITAECAVCETVLPTVSLVSFAGSER